MLKRLGVPDALQVSKAASVRLGINVAGTAVEWAARWRSDDQRVIQMLGGTWFGQSIDCRIDRIQELREGARLDFGDLEEGLSPWLPDRSRWPKAVSETRLRDLLLTEARAYEGLASFEAVLTDDCVLVNPWTVEISREQRMAGFEAFRASYDECTVDLKDLLVDADQPGLFAARRTFRCRNRDTGQRGEDDDMVFGEVVEEHGLRLRYSRVVFDPAATACVQVPAKSTGAIYGWASHPPLSTFSSSGGVLCGS